MIKHEPINLLTIKGFKSILNLDQFELRDLNILIGANGSGKSNFISFFNMLGELVEGRLQLWTSLQGSADRLVSFGVKETSLLQSTLKSGQWQYRFSLKPTIDGSFTFLKELFTLAEGDVDLQTSTGPGIKESELKDFDLSGGWYPRLASIRVYHFHDTSDTAGVKRRLSLHDNEYLRSDASNLAAFLYRMKNQSPEVYQQIRKTVSLALPFFDDFVLKPEELTTEEKLIRLLWRQQGSDYTLWPSQLSDGAIRFICLVTALLQPEPPSTIIIDEPELGLHPYAITLLASLLRSSSKRMQVIVSTQSVPLVNQFSIDDLVIVERENGASVFKRHSEAEFETWLEEYSVGELWEKNVLGGRPL